MKVLVIGSGGREHALVWKLRQSARISKLYCAPGNGGISREAECLPVDQKNLDSLVALANELRPDVTVVGPEPLGKACVMNGRTQVQCYVPLPGGEVLSPGPDTFWHTDWLGSVRWGSSASQRTITFDRAFGPFGETYDAVTGGTSNPQFASLTQDTISGEYDTDAREYHPVQGRWVSPDPAGILAVNPADPQSWNRYAYVDNQPLMFTDTSGLLLGPPSPVDVCGEDPSCSHDPLDCNPIDIFCAPDAARGPFLLPPNLPIPRLRLFGILPGENSVNIGIGSGNVFTDLWQDALGLPTIPCGAQFGPWCDPSKLPNPWIWDLNREQPCLAGAGPLALGQSRCGDFGFGAGVPDIFTGATFGLWGGRQMASDPCARAKELFGYAGDDAALGAEVSGLALIPGGQEALIPGGTYGVLAGLEWDAARRLNKKYSCGL